MIPLKTTDRNAQRLEYRFNRVLHRNKFNTSLELAILGKIQCNSEPAILGNIHMQGSEWFLDTHSNTPIPYSQIFVLKMTNGIRKVRKGVDIIDKEFLILVSLSRKQDVLPCFIPHRVLLAAKNWRELYKNPSVLSSLDAYTQNQIQSK